MSKKYNKLLNICTAICLIAYLFAIFSYYISTNNYYKSYQLAYEKLMEETLDFNNSIKDNNDNITENETPLFLDAKSAINYAFKNFYSYNSYEIQTEGTVNAGSFGVIATVITQGFEIRYSNGDSYSETKQFELKNSLGSNLGQSKASSYLYKNGNIYLKETKDVNYIDGIISSQYSTDFKKIGEDNHRFYIINNETITKSTYFSVNYNAYTGKIESYSASAKLNVVTAVKGMDAQMKQQGGLNSLPKFSNLEIHCVISKDGELQAFTVEQEYQSSITISVLGNVDYSSSDKFTYIIKSVNSSPSIVEPDV